MFRKKDWYLLYHINPKNPTTSRGYTFFSEVTCKRLIHLWSIGPSLYCACQRV
jgi:hypothetical protein